jgi:LysR family transcriptional regulator, glycine cleavage system transcriptional activator
MRIRSPSLPELHAFVHAARLHSFIKAAQSLEVTAGAISRSIARIEAHLGMSVFQRHSRGCVLTPQGRLYFDSVAPAIDALEGAALMAQGLQAAGEGAELKLSVTPTLATHWLIRRLPDFYRLHPEVKLSFVPYHRDELPMVASQGMSIRGGNGQWPAGVEGDYLTGKHIVAVIRPADRVALNSPCDLIQRPLLAHSLHPDTLKNWFAGAGCTCEDLSPVAHFEQVSQLIAAAVAGLGVAVVQRCLVQEHLLSGQLALAHPLHVVNDRGYFLCYPEALRRSAVLASFRSWLQAQGQEATGDSAHAAANSLPGVSEPDAKLH